MNGPIREDIEAKRIALEAQGIKLDMSHVAKLTAEETKQQKLLTNLKTWEPHLKTLRTQYVATLGNRWAGASEGCRASAGLCDQGVRVRLRRCCRTCRLNCNT